MTRKLTKLGPLFNSVDGYMKYALIPTVTRNDTHQQGHERDQMQKGRRPGDNNLQSGPQLLMLTCNQQKGILNKCNVQCL